MFPYRALDVLDSVCFSRCIYLQDDNVNAPELRLFFEFLQVLECGRFYSSLFTRGNRFFRRPPIEVALASYFDENQEVLVFGDDVDFAAAAAEIGLDDTVALFLKEITGQFLAYVAGILPGCPY
jgi:hypothetical protein